MENADQIYSHFLRAFRFVLKDKDKTQTYFATASGVTDPWICQILTTKKKASLKSQVAIANAANYSYEDFLALGRKLKSGKSEKDEIKMCCQLPFLLGEPVAAKFFEILVGLKRVGRLDAAHDILSVLVGI